MPKVDAAMAWGVIGSGIVILMIALAMLGKINSNDRLIWFGLLMAASFAASVVIWAVVKTVKGS